MCGRVLHTLNDNTRKMRKKEKKEKKHKKVLLMVVETEGESERET